MRRDLREDDGLVDILYSGVCHSDLHTARAEWDGTVYANGTIYPALPVHEIVGRVSSVGSAVTCFTTLLAIPNPPPLEIACASASVP